MISLLGNLSRDFIPGEPQRVGGGPFHAARALRRLRVEARIFTRCATVDRDALLPPLVALGTPVTFVPGVSTATFHMFYEGDRRTMTVDTLGDTWLPDDLPAFPAATGWVHVAALARSDFPAETLTVIAHGRKVLLDGQGLVRPARTGALVLDGNFDEAVLEHVWALKLSDEEAEVLGDPASLPVREVLVTHGSRGSTVYYGGQVEEIAARKVPGDPTGAGDAFSIAYVVARAEGAAPAAAARRATAIVGAVLEER
ncbi:MAG: PfkB family carbohydrate kinase [Actinomycetes bacterium]